MLTAGHNSADFLIHTHRLSVPTLSKPLAWLMRLPRLLAWLALAIGLCIGFYDGFFGPGTGSFFIFLFVRVLGYDFLHASAAAKLLNIATNVAALALCNVGGSLVGTRLALRHGAGFVRGMFITVVSALILKTGYDAFLR